MNRLKKSDGKWDLFKILIVPVLLWASYVTFQAYEVGSNKSALVETKTNLRRDIDNNKTEIEKNNGVHHRRMTKEREAREAHQDKVFNIIIKTYELMLKQDGCDDSSPGGLR